jgi:hypothetical protein
VRQDRSVPTRRDLLTFCVPTASARIHEAASVGLSFNTPSLPSRIAWLRHFVRKSNLCSQVFSVLLKLPFCPFPSESDGKIWLHRPSNPFLIILLILLPSLHHTFSILPIANGNCCRDWHRAFSRTVPSQTGEDQKLAAKGERDRIRPRTEISRDP